MGKQKALPQGFTDKLRVEGIYAQGYGNISKMVMRDTRITPTAKAIYAYFCSYAGAGTQAFPCVELIISDLSITKGTYYTHLKLLKKYDYIHVEQIKEDNKFSHNVYTLVINPDPAPEQITMDDCRKPEKEKNGKKPTGTDSDYKAAMELFTKALENLDKKTRKEVVRKLTEQDIKKILIRFVCVKDTVRNPASYIEKMLRNAIKQSTG